MKKVSGKTEKWLVRLSEPHAIFAISATFLLSCHEPATVKRENDLSNEENATHQDRQKMTVMFRSPYAHDKTTRILWQRSYPKAYASLIERAEQSRSRSGNDDPFAEPIEIPDSQLTPQAFPGISDWGLSIVPRTFDQLGYPLGNGNSASYDHESGLFEITHIPAAIASFRKRFPEFRQLKGDRALIESHSASE